ncbi:Origin recognition complex subunit 3 [Datura stramonium]|uniref:Origin recognition complex subunit 3 n=1 Tax=Datura stramonium TaxID=4076 RepID=A0ABS8TCT4_DATST|nr:Origin recognition complex subunit 3 [Datura stramonium]
MSPGKPSKRRLDTSPKVSLNNENMNEYLKMEAFQCVWSKIESKIKDVLRSINADVFDEIGRWARESFNEICSCRGPVDPSKSSLPYPFVHNGGLVKKLFTGLVFTKNIETVDDILTFAELGLNLKSHGCYVANISSLDFSTKNGIEGCLRAFLRQLLRVEIEAADISLLASWYSDHGKYEKPVVVIIEDMERCSGALLSDFINMLRNIVVLSFLISLGIVSALSQGLHARHDNLPHPGLHVRATTSSDLCRHGRGRGRTTVEIGEDEQQWRRGRGRTTIQKTKRMNNSEEMQKTKRMSSAEYEEDE